MYQKFSDISEDGYYGVVTRQVATRIDGFPLDGQEYQWSIQLFKREGGEWFEHLERDFVTWRGPVPEIALDGAAHYKDFFRYIYQVPYDA